MSVEFIKLNIESIKKSIIRERESKKRAAENLKSYIAHNPKSPNIRNRRDAYKRYAENFDNHIERLKRELEREKEHLARAKALEKAAKKRK